MTWVLLGLFVALVLGLAYASRRTRASTSGCCAPADPRHDLRMRDALGDSTTPEG